MKKLFNLKEWLTLEDSARHLSILFGQEVSEADVLRLCLDGHLTLSINFVNHGKGRIGEIVQMEEAKMNVITSEPGDISSWIKARNVKMSDVEKLPDQIKCGLDNGSLAFMPVGDVISKQEVIEYAEGISTLTGVWDLPMIGGEKLDIEHKYQKLTGGPSVTLINIDGVYVRSADGKIASIQERYDENVYQKGSLAHRTKLEHDIFENNLDAKAGETILQQHKLDREEYLKRKRSRPPEEDYYPMGGLPDDSVLVVRTEALRNFENSLKEGKTPLTQNERYSLLTIIAALCDYSGKDIKARGVSVQISKLTDKIGAPVSDDTVRRVLAKIQDALDSRMK